MLAKGEGCECCSGQATLLRRRRPQHRSARTSTLLLPPAGIAAGDTQHPQEFVTLPDPRTGGAAHGVGAALHFIIECPGPDFALAALQASPPATWLLAATSRSSTGTSSSTAAGLWATAWCRVSSSGGRPVLWRHAPLRRRCTAAAGERGCFCRAWHLADGGLFLATPVDPLLVLLPVLEAARDGQNVFQDLEQLLG